MSDSKVKSLNSVNDVIYSSVEFLPPEDRASLAAVSKDFPAIVEEVGAEHYKALAGRAAEGLNSNRQVHDLISAPDCHLIFDFDP